jgi:hypothetical protein
MLRRGRLSVQSLRTKYMNNADLRFRSSGNTELIIDAYSMIDSLSPSSWEEIEYLGVCSRAQIFFLASKIIQ